MGRRIRTSAQRAADRDEVLRIVARALLEAEPAEVNKVITHHAAVDDHRPPRIPAIGLHPGAIPGTSPHTARITHTPRRRP